MSLRLEHAHPADAGRIAEIHMAAFGSNAMLQAQFPMPALHKALQHAIKLKALADIDDSKTTVLIVRDVPGQQVSTGDQDRPGDAITPQVRGLIVAFAKWSHPVFKGEDYMEPPWLWPEGTNLDVLEGWTGKTEEAQEKALGQTPCYSTFYTSFVRTYQFQPGWQD